MKKMANAIIIAGIALALTIITYIFKLGGNSHLLITDVITLLFAGIAVYFGYRAFSRYGIKSIHGKSLFLILLGIFLWFSPELLWLIFQKKVLVILETLRFLGYIPIFIGFVYILKLSDPKFRQHNKHLLRIAGVFLLFAIIYLTLVPIFFGTKSVFDTIITNGYIVTDFILLFGIGILLKVSHSFRGGKMSKAWIIFALGFFSIFLFDLYFALNYTTIYLGHISEILWILGYILIALGFYYNCLILDNLRNRLAKAATAKAAAK